MILALIIGFGWATTPVNPSYLRGNPRKSYAIVSLAGPIANLLMAGLFSLPILLGFVEITLPGEILPSVYSFLVFGVYYNLLLFALNMIPIPPLDGFSILMGVLPAELAYQLQPLRQYSQILFLGVFFLLPAIGVDVAFKLIQLIVGRIYPILLGGFAPLFV
ncbi:MAG: site-2 protease family protein [Anaerolineae bacterium]